MGSDVETQLEKYVPQIRPEDVGYAAPFAEAPAFSIDIYSDSTVAIRQTVAYAVPKDAYSMIAMRIKADVQLSHLPAMNHRRKEIVLRMAQSPIRGTKPLDWFIERIYRQYAESRLRPADYTVNWYQFPYPDYAGIS